MRISRKRVENILSVLSDNDKRYRLITHENLGDRKSVYYTYSVVIDKPVMSEHNYYVKSYNMAIEKVVSNKTLKEIYEIVFQIMEETI